MTLSHLCCCPPPELLQAVALVSPRAGVVLAQTHQGRGEPRRLQTCAIRAQELQVST